jgi:hypothetical protein
MEAHADITTTRRTTVLRRTYEGQPARLTVPQWLQIGVVAGLVGGLLMAVPLIIWDWVKAGHIALELPAAATAWLFGLNYFSNTAYHVGPILLGIALMGVYWIVSGLVFAGIADRILRVSTLGASLAAGALWSFVSFIFFWYMLLPIARDGAPFRTTAIATGPSVAPNWVWILSFTVLGFATALAYAAMRPLPARVVAADGDGYAE